VERSGREDCVERLPGQVDILEPTEVEVDGIVPGQTPSGDGDHVRTRIDGFDTEASLDEQLRQLPGPAAHLENPRARTKVATLDREINERQRLAGTNGLVCLSREVVDPT